MENRNEIRKAHEIVDGIDSVYEREQLRKLLPPRPEFTFGDAVEALKGMASEDDIHLWNIIRSLEGFEKFYRQPLDAGGEDEGSPSPSFSVGSIAARNGEDDVWVRGLNFWTSPSSDAPLFDDKVLNREFRILRDGFYTTF